MSDKVEPCPEGLEQYNFEVEANPPDPDARDIQDRKNSQVIATYEGVPAGYLAYGLGPVHGTVSITRMETYEAFRCRGCATQMRDALHAAFPDLRVVDGGSTNSPIGDLVLGRWREKGELKDA